MEETKGQTPEIEGLENFSFGNLPEEEIELRHQFDYFIEQIRLNEVNFEADNLKHNSTQSE